MLESKFDITFTAKLARKEKQIQQNYRPIIGIHKWFARRSGTVFRNLLLSEFNGEEPIGKSYWKSHQNSGVIADPFMGGGTPIYEANRLGFSVVGTDINPMSFWIVRQALNSLDVSAFRIEADSVINKVDKEIGGYYKTKCLLCQQLAQVKYFIWVKTINCPYCKENNDLFPGYLLAENVRHPKNVIVCAECGSLNELDFRPSEESPEICQNCGHTIKTKRSGKRNSIACRKCDHLIRYPQNGSNMPPKHRMWAIEYYCENCKPAHKGRFFKQPDADDIRLYAQASEDFHNLENFLPIPQNEIPLGDETKRLRRWGYRHFYEMFNCRQLLGLGKLFSEIEKLDSNSIREALLTVFSDFLRYQNMLCRYDTYALKCQDIFSVHGFPVGLVQCENNILGIPKIGSGAFRHFIEKYIRAKEYCLNPFETDNQGKRKKIIAINGEKIEADFANKFPDPNRRQALILAMPADKLKLPKNSLSGVFTDPPYYNNVQYSELIDFCYIWLRQALKADYPAFEPETTKNQEELTGNETMGRGLSHFTRGLSIIFCHYSDALKPNAPFVFTYHHNDPSAYIPVVVALLDAELYCTKTLPAPAEMSASLHIARANSSVVDSIFICRKLKKHNDICQLDTLMQNDVDALKLSGLRISEGDIRCLMAGHIARVGINQLSQKWDKSLNLEQRISVVDKKLSKIRHDIDEVGLIESIRQSLN